MVKRNWYKIDDKSKYIKRIVNEPREVKQKESYEPGDTLEAGIAKALRQRSEQKTFCEHCKSRSIAYQGLGVYLCSECKGLTMTNYGKAREFLDKVGNCTAAELMEGTGLTKVDIDSLVKAGSIEYRKDGHVRIPK